MLKGVKAVLFDLDGTLVDSMWMWKDIDVEYLGRYGRALPPELQKEIEGMSFPRRRSILKSALVLTRVWRPSRRNGSRWRRKNTPMRFP